MGNTFKTTSENTFLFQPAEILLVFLIECILSEQLQQKNFSKRKAEIKNNIFSEKKKKRCSRFLIQNKFSINILSTLPPPILYQVKYV